MKNEEIYEELKKEFDFENESSVLYVIFKFKEISNTELNNEDVRDTQWWREKYEESLRSINVINEELL